MFSQETSPPAFASISLLKASCFFRLIKLAPIVSGKESPIVAVTLLRLLTWESRSRVYRVWELVLERVLWMEEDFIMLVGF